MKTNKNNQAHEISVYKMIFCEPFFTLNFAEVYQSYCCKPVSHHYSDSQRQSKKITLPSAAWTHSTNRRYREHSEQTRDRTVESVEPDVQDKLQRQQQAKFPIFQDIIIGRLSNNNLLSCPFFTLKISSLCLLLLQITYYSILSRFLICSLSTRLMYWLKERSSSSASSLILSIISASRVMLTLFFNGFMQALLLLISITNRRYNIEKQYKVG